MKSELEFLKDLNAILEVWKNGKCFVEFAKDCVFSDIKKRIADLEAWPTAWREIKSTADLPPMLEAVLIRLKSGDVVIAKLRMIDVEENKFRFNHLEADRMYAFCQNAVAAWCHIPK
jgi:translation initiation factor IF-1